MFFNNEGNLDGVGQRVVTNDCGRDRLLQELLLNSKTRNDFTLWFGRSVMMMIDE